MFCVFEVAGVPGVSYISFIKCFLLQLSGFTPCVPRCTFQSRREVNVALVCSFAVTLSDWFLRCRKGNALLPTHNWLRCLSACTDFFCILSGVLFESVSGVEVDELPVCSLTFTKDTSSYSNFGYRVCLTLIHKTGWRSRGERFSLCFFHLCQTLWVSQTNENEKKLFKKMLIQF